MIFVFRKIDYYCTDKTWIINCWSIRSMFDELVHWTSFSHTFTLSLSLGLKLSVSKSRWRTSPGFKGGFHLTQIWIKNFYWISWRKEKCFFPSLHPVRLDSPEVWREESWGTGMSRNYRYVGLEAASEAGKKWESKRVSKMKEKNRNDPDPDTTFISLYTFQLPVFPPSNQPLSLFLFILSLSHFSSPSSFFSLIHFPFLPSLSFWTNLNTEKETPKTSFFFAWTSFMSIMILSFLPNLSSPLEKYHDEYLKNPFQETLLAVIILQF